MIGEREVFENDKYIIGIVGVGDDTGVSFNARSGNGNFGHSVKLRLCDVDQFISDLKRLKDAAEKRLDGGVEFIAE